MRKLATDELGRKSKEQVARAEKFPIILVLENIRSAYNVGSVLRTADAFMLCAVHTVGYTAHPPHAQVAKTALGADETVSSRHFRSSEEAIADLRHQGFRVFAAEHADSSCQLNLASFQPNEKVAIIFGNEVTGVDQSTIDLCEGCLEIPQFGMKHSLNVAVAAGVIAWEMVRGRIV